MSDSSTRLIINLDRLYAQIEPLLRESFYQKSSSPQNTQLLDTLIHEWWSSEDCAEELGCAANKCPFARALDWVTYAGHGSLCDLLFEQLEDQPPSDIPEGKKGDIFNCRRRPGHFNP